MPSNLIYMPAFRARQQELIVLKSFDFGERIFPLVEIIKAKDRANSTKSTIEIYSELITEITAVKVFVDLPTYIKDLSGMQDEVLSFNRTVLSNIDNRIAFYNTLAEFNAKIIPVVSSLYGKTREENTITNQFNQLKEQFPSVAIRTFTNNFNSDLEEIKSLLTADDFLIYDIDEAVGLTNPIIRRDTTNIKTITAPEKIALRSAVNTDIQNVKLNHGEIVYQADNSLIDLFHSYGFNAFGDYAGIKKDDLSSGGTISPGFIFYNPVDKLYYGYRGDIKNLSEFETTIVPAVLNSPLVPIINNENADYLNAQNEGWNTLQRISNGEESGKSQAKFKKISIEHYLHCMRVGISSGAIV